MDHAVGKLEKEIFSALAWCRAIMADADFAEEPTSSRFYHVDTGENRLLANTLNTKDTIEAWYSLYRRPNKSTRRIKDEVRVFLALREGLNGYPRVCHGGITATVLDEVMSILVSVCRESQNLSLENVTAELNIKYLRPVPLPSVVLVRAKVQDIQKDKKYYVDAIMEDAAGTVLTRAKGLFIQVPRERL
jgi:uncharacterized protein (TIGR00369 family)